MILSAVIAYLETIPGLTSLLAYHPTSTGKHAIYAGSIPQRSKKPLLVLTELDGDPVYHLKGDSGLATEVFEIEIQVDELQGWAKLEQIQEQVRLAMIPTGGTWGGVVVQGCTLSKLRADDFKKPDKSDIPVLTGGYQVDLYFEQPAIEV